jgi:protein SCO1/2
MKKRLLLITILLLPALVYMLFLSTGKHGMERLPIYYPTDEVRTKIIDGKEQIDTVYHTIPPFKLINQKGDTITEKTVEDKIYVANFFFTTCPTICPIMMAQMQRINEYYNKKNDFIILSHTVNPAHDTVDVLAEYAKHINAQPEKWMLVTGNKKDIYDLGVDGYKLAVDEDPRAPGGFLHSELFVLVDKQRRIRGYYDGTDTAAVSQLIKDINVLTAEYEAKKGKTKIEQRH